MRIGWAMLLVAVVAIILVTPYLLLNPEKRDLDEATRARLGGSYVRLSRGVTHYALEGPPQGQLVVLVHGGTVPMYTWDELAPILTAAGFRILRYDMYGRGYSDRPRVTYNRALYQSQLLELLDALNLHDPLDLVGYSLGGAIVTDFEAQHPERVRRLALISPVVYNYPSPRAFRPPLIGEFLGRIIGIRTVIKRANTMYAGTSLGQHHAALFAEQTTYKGFQSSLLSMIRSDALGDHRDSYIAVGKQKCRVLLIWGARDTEITEEVVNTARKLIPQVEFHAVQDAGHSIVFQKPGQVSALLINFLQSNP